MFYTLIKMFVYNLMLPIHKIWDITCLFILNCFIKDFPKKL